MTKTPSAPRDPDAGDRTITVATPDLRRALKAVMPHHERRTAEDSQALHRFRFTLDAPAQQPEDDVFLRVLASNGTTTAAALVKVTDDSQAGMFAPPLPSRPPGADLLPHDVRGVLSLFGVARKTDIVEGEEQMELRFTTEWLTFTDSGGMFAGQRVRYPQLPFSTAFPDIEQISRRALAESAGAAIAPARPVYAEAHVLALFNAAGKAYEQPVQVEPIGAERKQGWLVTCGARFVGTVSGELDSDGSVQRREGYRRQLLQRFGVVERELTAV